MTKPIDIYDRGYVDGLRAFAWWKDGEQFVGTCGMKMTDAILARKESPGYDPPQCCIEPEPSHEIGCPDCGVVKVVPEAYSNGKPSAGTCPKCEGMLFFA